MATITSACAAPTSSPATSLTFSREVSRGVHSITLGGTVKKAQLKRGGSK
jgi:hypothetical protein